MKKKTTKKVKKENKQIVEIHIYVHQFPNSQIITPNTYSPYPNYPITTC